MRIFLLPGNELIQHEPGVRTAIDVVAQKDQYVALGNHPAVQELLVQVHQFGVVTVDVTNGMDAGHVHPLVGSLVDADHVLIGPLSASAQGVDAGVGSPPF